jgi:phosphonate transport system substrate-binding protein
MVRARFAFGLPPSAQRDTAALSGVLSHLAENVRRLVRVEIEPVMALTYAELFSAFVSGTCDAAWCPPFIALDLMERDAARPVVAIERVGGVRYYSALVAAARFGASEPRELRGARVGWVAPESASGYVVPLLHLSSLGLDPKALFASERFCGSHTDAARALERGEVDVIATYAAFDAATGTLEPPRIGVRTRVVAAAGPIPGDVIVARSSLPAVVQQALARGLINLPLHEADALREIMQQRRFVPVSRSHVDALRRMRSHAFASSLGPPPQPEVVGRTGTA